MYNEIVEGDLFMNRKLDTFFYPKSIAIIGASNKVDTVGYRLLYNVKNCGYEGAVYPINPKYTECQGLQCFSRVQDLDEIPQLVMIAIPAKAVLQTIKECAKFGVKNFYIISSGFGELGAEGKHVEHDISLFAQENDLNIIGPNTIGFINNGIKLNANFSQSGCKDGNAVLISQSGALTSGIMNILEDSQVGLKLGISIGNACDVSVADLIKYFNKKKDISQILLYLESIPQPEEFMQACKDSDKKIICVKSGRSARGAIAASSHTGALASTDTIVDAFLQQCGVIRVNSIAEMVNVAAIFSTMEKIPMTKNVVVITNAGGPAIMTVDALSELGLNLYEFSDEEKDYMRSYLQSQASVKNPIDMVASASIDDYKKTLEFCINNDKIDAIICIHLYIMGTTSKEIASIVDSMKEKYPNKMIASVFITHLEEMNEIKQTIKNIPIFESGEDASKAIKQSSQKFICSREKQRKIRNTNIDKIFENVRQDNRNLLTTYESLEVLKELELPLVKFDLVKDPQSAKNVANKINYPVVVKITSKTISHKSDVGGVKVGIKNDIELIKALDEIKNNLKSHNCIDGLDGFIIQEMKSSNREFVYGIVNDAQFGLCSMFGLGGIFVESFKDVCFKVLPTSNEEILQQIHSLKASKLLGSVRNLPCADIDKLVDTMQIINNFSLSYNIKELDLNPVLIDDKTGNISLIDARIKI